MNIIEKSTINEIQHEIYETPQFKSWLTSISHMIKPQEGLSALLDVVTSVNSAVSECFKNTPYNFDQVGLVLKHAVSMITLPDLIGDLEWWICQKARNRQEKISMFFFTSQKCVRSALFILEIRGSRINKFSLPDGRTLSIELVLNVMNIGGLIFNIWHNLKELNRANLQGKININVLKNLEKKRMTSKTEIRKWKEIVDKDYIAKRKICIAIALDVANVSITILTLIGSSTAILSLPIVATTLIFLGVGSSGFWLYKCYYEERYRDIEIYQKYA
jgi:hypothetical protein